MVAFFIREPHVRPFMHKLFNGAMFDMYEARSVSVTHFIKLDADGAYTVKNTDGGGASYASWSELKPYIFYFIKGKIKPSHIKIVFSCPASLLASVSPEAAAAFINFEYAENEVRLLTATSRREFSLNKEHDALWDEYARGFLRANEIAFEEES